MKQKAQYLGFVTRKLLLTHLGLYKETDRDSYSNKRIDLAGTLLLELYRELLLILSDKLPVRWMMNIRLILNQSVIKIYHLLSMNKIYQKCFQIQ